MGTSVAGPGLALAVSAPDARDHQYVLRARQLRLGAALEQTAQFGDDVWPLGPATLQHQQRALMLDFTTLPTRYRQVAKELFHAMLSGELPPGERRPQIATVRSVFSQLKKFLDWLNTRTPGSRRPAAPALADL